MFLVPFIHHDLVRTRLFCIYNLPTGHVVTGDLTCIPQKGLRSLFKKGPKYRLPSRIDFNKCRCCIADRPPCRPSPRKVCNIADLPPGRYATLQTFPRKICNIADLPPRGKVCNIADLPLTLQIFPGGGSATLQTFPHFCKVNPDSNFRMYRKRDFKL